MNVIDTAKIIAARTSERERPPTGGIFTDPRRGGVTELLPRREDPSPQQCVPQVSESPAGKSTVGTSCLGGVDLRSATTSRTSTMSEAIGTESST